MSRFTTRCLLDTIPGEIRLKLFRSTHLYLLVGLLIGALVVGATYRYPLVLDDPFITYRYALNLIGGNGFVYNAGERVLSTTTPLYALFLAAVGLIFRDLPALGFWVSVVCLGLSAWFVYEIGVFFKRPLGGIV